MFKKDFWNVSVKNGIWTFLNWVCSKRNLNLWAFLGFFEPEIKLFCAFLSAATLVAADYGFICPPRFMSVCWCVVCVGTNDYCNFSAVRSRIGLKLGGDLELVSQISVHVLVSRFDCFLYCKQTKEQKNAEIAKIAVLKKLAFSPPCRVRLI